MLTGNPSLCTKTCLVSRTWAKRGQTPGARGRGGGGRRMKTSLGAPFHPIVRSLPHPAPFTATRWRREAFTRVHVSSAPRRLKEPPPASLSGPPAQHTVGVCYRRVRRSRGPPYPKTTRRFYGRRRYVVQVGRCGVSSGVSSSKQGAGWGGGCEGAPAKAPGICARINTGRGAGAEAS